MKYLRACVFNSPTPWPITLDHRFQGLSYYFSITETEEYMETVRFMESNINKSLTKYQNGITLDQVLNARNSKLTRAQIIDQKLYVVQPESEPIFDRGPAHTVSLLLDVLRIYQGRVPDVDIILHSNDDPPRENLDHSPILTFNKIKGENILAIPFIVNKMEDIYALNSDSYFRKSYKFENKESKAVWRGGMSGEKRNMVYRWSRNHTDIIDYEFSVAHTGYRSNNYMSWREQEHKYKYMLDVDGWGWSSRFIQLLNIDMAIVKLESPNTDFCNEMLTPDVHYLTFSNESTLVNAIQYLIDKGDDFALNMIQERRNFAKRYCSRDAQMIYMFTLLNMYAKLQTFQVVKDSMAVYVSNDVPSINYLELLLFIFVAASVVLSAVCCAQNFPHCRNYCSQIVVKEKKYTKVTTEEV